MELKSTELVGKKSGHIDTLDFLRGIAALSVVLFHYSGASIASIKPNVLTPFFSWGKLGVQVFFIISGFIIPYSMYVSGYTIKNAGKFILKRMTRVGPPSWIIILLTIIMYYGVILFKGSPIEGFDWPGVGLKTVLANITYTFTLFDIGKYNAVFWTLEVELQFYLLMAVLLPLLLAFRKNLIVFTIILLAVNFTGFIDAPRILFLSNNGLFLLGMLLFMYRKNIIEKNYFIYVTMAIMMLTYAQMGLPYTFAGIIGLLIVAFVNFNNPVTSFIGKISYSLYITHNLTGAIVEMTLNKVIGLHPGEPLKIVLLLLYTAIAILAAWIFFLVVERPFIKLSQKISWRKRVTSNKYI